MGKNPFAGKPGADKGKPSKGGFGKGTKPAFMKKAGMPRKSGAR